MSAAQSQHQASYRSEANGLTRALAERAVDLRFSDIPDDVVEVARQALLDWFGVTLGGSQEAASTILLQTLPTSEDSRAAAVVGHRVRLPALQAALVNGTSSHVLDFDDVNASLLGHVSVAVLGAALALGEQLDLNGEDLIAAYVAGYETTCRIAAAIGPEPYLRGFHSTGTVGTFGAAAACAHLLRLDASQTATAFGLAATQAAGIKGNFGTMTKSFHAGKACESGLMSALLAARGFTAADDAIESEQGFAAASGGACDVEAALADPPERWYARGNLFKYHASCYWTHSMLEGILGLTARGDVRAANVERVAVHVSDLELGTCAIPAPSSGLEVKFSLVHLAAMALLGRDTRVITDADAVDPEVVALRSRVALVHDGVPGQPSRVEITPRSGHTVDAAVDVNKPQRDLASQYGRLAQKFDRLAERVVGSERAQELRQLVRALDRNVAIRDLMSRTIYSH